MILFILTAIVCYFLGVYMGWKFHDVSFHMPKKESMAPKTFTEDTFFVEGKDVLESFKRSSTLSDFINQLK